VSGTSRRQNARRLLCVYQHAPTRDAPGFYRHRHYFAELVRRGWEVDVVSTPVDYLTGTVPAGYAKRLFTHEEIDGIEHHWAWAASGIHRSRAHRAANYASFAAMSAFRGVTLRRPDLVWASSPPLPVGAVGEVLARRFRVPWLFEIRDLWPESAASIGWLQQESMLYRTLEWLSHRAASRANCVVVPTPGLERDAYAHGAKTVHVVPGIVLDANAEAARPQVRESLGVAPDTCLLAYVGALGIANGLDVILDAAKLVLPDPRIAFLLVGDGSDRARLEQRVAGERISNVTMLGAVPKSQVPELLAASDVCLHVLRPDPIFEGAQPTKVLEYFGAHRPFITTVDGVPRALAEASGGSFAPTAEALAAESKRWAGLSAVERAPLNEQAFRYGMSRFGLEASVDRLERLLVSLIDA
jgi:glycosyltransferase involved in cell wall biosynthesis